MCAPNDGWIKDDQRKLKAAQDYHGLFQAVFGVLGDIRHVDDDERGSQVSCSGDERVVRPVAGGPEIVVQSRRSCLNSMFGRQIIDSVRLVGIAWNPHLDCLLVFLKDVYRHFNLVPDGPFFAP